MASTIRIVFAGIAWLAWLSPPPAAAQRDDELARSLFALPSKGGWRPIVSVGPALHYQGAVEAGPGRPLVTRDAGKMAAQPYKTPQPYPQLGAPVSSYLGPFALHPAGLAPYKGAYQFDSNLFVRHPPSQPAPRPYGALQAQLLPGQMLLGKRLKHGQLQQLQQLHYHQAHFPPKKQQDLLKPGVNYYKHASPPVPAVTYKPPASLYHAYGLKEEPFGPIPSSILGSFSSFGHASVKAREPQTSTKTTPPSTVAPEAFAAQSTAQSTAHTAVRASSARPASAQVSLSFVPPPQAVRQPEASAARDNFRNRTEDGRSPPGKLNFVPSPPDPLTKYQSASVRDPKPEKYVYNTNLPTRRPGAAPPPAPSPTPAPGPTAAPAGAAQLPTPHTRAPDRFPGSSKFGPHDDVSYFPPRAQEYFDSKYPKVHYEEKPKDSLPYRGSYEVTETWGSSGETNTQPTLHSWLNPSQAYKQYGGVLSTSKHPSFNTIPTNENKIVPVPYLPTSVPSKMTDGNKNFHNDASTVYSTISENNKHKTFFSQLENSLSPSVDVDSYSKRPIADDDLTIALIDPFDDNTRQKSTSTQSYDEFSTQQVSGNRRKPSRYRPQQETSTSPNNDEDFREFTTRFETYKEHSHETENDLQQSELPTIPPNKHFRRPSGAATPTITWEEDKLRKKKHRRRRPNKPSTTEESYDDIITTTSTTTTTTTEPPLKSYRFRTTTITPEEEVTKPFRPKLRLSSVHKVRPTKATSQADFTSSAQPTMLPTTPATIRPKLHSRIRVTTMSSLDLEDLLDTTTVKIKMVENNDKQSSIMKIAKDIHFSRSPVKIHNTAGFDNFKETPDYSHKQDEKDTPTSDVSISTSDHAYSAQKLRDSFIEGKNENRNVEKLMSTFTESTSAANGQLDATASSLLDDNLSAHNIQIAQTTRNEQIFTELKSGNRGSSKLDEHAHSKEHNENNNEDTSSPGVESPVTTPPSATKTHRLKIKPNKYDNNRPRFSVKDYRNRLNQYTSTSTEKPSVSSESSTRLRFPNRSRFPSFKDGDSKASASDFSSTTELPRKKFTPKDPRHKGLEDEMENTVATSGKTSHRSSTVAVEISENEVVTKSPRLRPGARRDPTRPRKTTTIEPFTGVHKEETPHKPNPVYTNLKRPSFTSIRKRLPTLNKTDAEHSVSEATSLAAQLATEKIQEKNETSTEKFTSETAIMKIAKDDKKHGSGVDMTENPSADQSQRVADLTLVSSKEFTPGLFKAVPPNSRRVPSYFTIATDDPILPIEAFFPQLNQKKET